MLASAQSQDDRYSTSHLEATSASFVLGVFCELRMNGVPGSSHGRDLVQRELRGGRDSRTGTCRMCEQGQAVTGEGLGGLLVGAGRDAVSLPGPGGTEHGQDGADTPTDSSHGRSVGGVGLGRAIVGLGERGRRFRERPTRDEAAHVGLGGVLPHCLAGGGVRVR
jgi:hypothetical protein